MNRIKKSILWSVMPVILFIAFSGFAYGQNEIIIDKIVAKVDDYIILKSEVEKYFGDLLASGQAKESDAPEAKCQILEQFIIQKMMLAKAEIDSVTVEDKQVESQLDRRMQYFILQFGSAEKLEQAYGKTIGDFKGELREFIRDQMVAQKMEEVITENVHKPTPKEVKKFFNSLPKDSIPYFNSEVEISHIVKIPDVNKEQKRIVKEKIEKIKQSIIDGEDFGTIAKDVSEDYGSAKNGGDLGWLQRGTSVPEFEAAVFRMKPGELSKIVESQYGFHLIKLIDRRGNEYNAAHILMRPDYSTVDISYAEKFLDSLRNMILLDSISFEKAAKEYSEDKNSASNGGAISSEDGETTMFMDRLDSYLYFTIDTMEVKQISRPVPYRTDDGKSAVRIIYFKSKTQPHQANLEDDYQKLYNVTYSQKKNKAINEWFLKTKDEVFISIDEEFKDCNILGSQN